MAINGGRNMGKTWMKPELVVLVRGSAEERVLGACKAYFASSGSQSTDDGCFIGCYEGCDELLDS